MTRLYAQRSALVLFAAYLALFLPATATVALDRVPGWGLWMGSLLLCLQGAGVLTWLAWRHGWRGAVAGLLLGALGWGVERLGTETGFPFGRYYYTGVLQPKLFGVPLAICAAWMMVVPAASHLASAAARLGWARGRLLLTATLVLLLDLQIETVAALVNGYWVWVDTGPYYGVPTSNFVAWWFVGLGMGWVLEGLVGGLRSATGAHPSPGGGRRSLVARLAPAALGHMPAAMYLLSTLMFTAVNLSFGYLAAGLIGLALLAVVGGLFILGRAGAADEARLQSFDRSPADHA